MSYLSMVIVTLFCGVFVQASSFNAHEFGYSEEVLLNAMAERGAISYREAAGILDREAQLQEEDKGSSTSKVNRNEELSLAYIRQLQETENGYYSSSPSLVTPTVTYVEPENILSTTPHKGTLKGLFCSAQGYDNSDVHGFNKGWSKTNIGTVQYIFKQAFGEVAPLSMSALKAEILSYKDSSAIRKALAQLEAYGSSGFSDDESGVANTLGILSQNWHIASTATGLSRKFVFDESGVARNSRDFVIHSLLENAATGGGCSPGFAGRFVRDQLILLCVQGGVDGR